MSHRQPRSQCNWMPENMCKLKTFFFLFFARSAGSENSFAQKFIVSTCRRDRFGMFADTQHLIRRRYALIGLSRRSIPIWFIFLGIFFVGFGAMYLRCVINWICCEFRWHFACDTSKMWILRWIPSKGKQLRLRLDTKCSVAHFAEPTSMWIDWLYWFIYPLLPRRNRFFVTSLRVSGSRSCSISPHAVTRKPFDRVSVVNVHVNWFRNDGVDDGDLRKRIK